MKYYVIFGLGGAMIGLIISTLIGLDKIERAS
jgi:hypothetical protein